MMSRSRKSVLLGGAIVIGASLVSIFLLPGLLTLSVPSRVNTGGAVKVPVANWQAANPQKNPNNGNRPGGKGGRKMGDWLQAHKNLPPDQQMKALENDPFFKRLPPQRQNELRERLKNFNSMPPEKRDQALQRMEFLAKLSPQQREQLRNASQQLRGLPPERQVAVHKAVRHLRQMPPQERQQVLQSDRFRTTFSDQEQKLISQLTEMTPQDGGQNAQPK
jgi:Protein of unknown function (DUF3106)